MRMWFAFENDFGKPFRDAAYETFAKDRLKNHRASRQTNCAKRLASGPQTKPMFALPPRCSTTDRDNELIADRQQILLEKMTQMEDRLADGRTWLCGEQFTLADIALAPRVDMFPVIGMTDSINAFRASGSSWIASRHGRAGRRPPFVPSPGNLNASSQQKQPERPAGRSLSC